MTPLDDKGYAQLKAWAESLCTENNPCGNVLMEYALAWEKEAARSHGAGAETPCGAAPSSTRQTSEPGRIPDLEDARTNAEYWRDGAYKHGNGSEALLCMEQAANAWKNAAYAMADQRDAARSATGQPEKLAAILGLLQAAKCPACDGSGSIGHQVGEEEWVAEQCQWCDERSQIDFSPVDGGKAS